MLFCSFLWSNWGEVGKCWTQWNWEQFLALESHWLLWQCRERRSGQKVENAVALLQSCTEFRLSSWILRPAKGGPGIDNGSSCLLTIIVNITIICYHWYISLWYLICKNADRQLIALALICDIGSDEIRFALSSFVHSPIDCNVHVTSTKYKIRNIKYKIQHLHWAP